MGSTASLTILQNLADDKLHQTAVKLGKTRHEHLQATDRLERLTDYQREYCKKMQSHIIEKGMKVIDIHLYQAFLNDLNNVVSLQEQRVEYCEGCVESMLVLWRQDKQRLSAFNTLHQRSEATRLQNENRREQKLMDDFAQRSQRGKDEYAYNSSH